jgi:hypothetical protein
MSLTTMNPRVIMIVLALGAVQVLPPPRTQAGNPHEQLSLADLAAYRTALAGTATADDARASRSSPPRRVGFRELWDHAPDWRGRRVRVQGRVARIFRQGPVGSFAPLAEVWLTSPQGDPFCVVFPPGQTQQTRAQSRVRIPQPGQEVTFSGTFLKQIRYAAGDGDRLAPLIVGDQPPAASASVETPPTQGLSPVGSALRTLPSFESWSPATWALGLTLACAAAVVLAWRHVGTGY